MSTRKIFQQLSTNGDGTGTTSAIGDYAVTPETFFISPPSPHQYEIHRLIVAVQDGAQFLGGNYGSGDALVNGIEPMVTDASSTPITSLTGGFKIRQNDHWDIVTRDVSLLPWTGGMETVLCVKWDFESANIRLLLRPTERLEIFLNDDFSHLLDHRFIVQGLLGP